MLLVFIFGAAVGSVVTVTTPKVAKFVLDVIAAVKKKVD